MSPASSDASMLTVAVPAPLRPTLLAVHSCTRQHANLLVPGQIVSGLVWHCFSWRFTFSEKKQLARLVSGHMVNH
jgi:hypothetical protein